MNDTATLIHACYGAYQSRDRKAFESLLADDFTFSSPLDDNIDKAAYMERCWPNGTEHQNFLIEKLFTDGDEGFVTYRCERADGSAFRNTEFFKTHAGKVRHVDVYFGSDIASEVNEEAIQAILDGTIEAIRARDAQALLKDYAEDMIVFDVLEPLRYVSSKEVGERAAQWLSSFEGPIQYELKDVDITIDDEVAFCHCLNHVIGTKKDDGEEIDMTWRSTLGFQKLDGVWKVTHSHASVPFNMVTGMASTNLKVS
ncbi:nuclear transport factor 2 family protein [Roseimicrobium sp. ORNL1]|uniref:nuclear transport factor 2 family protein n=1 Tax=Roseimicrobium sp. ORNL1 TaxID=2711231 RepID=UPI0013E12AD1|nr:nuclear transport factor 2 family protein [Roseimicrobium sp. ORNL1]QIF00951.1 DUF4440 domain-containing protein [Roseimicrobium sp. ORNL1]